MFTEAQDTHNMRKRTHTAKERQSLDLRIVCDCYRRAGPLFVIVISLYPRTNAEGFANFVCIGRANATNLKGALQQRQQQP